MTRLTAGFVFLGFPEIRSPDAQVAPTHNAQTARLWYDFLHGKDTARTKIGLNTIELFS